MKNWEKNWWIHGVCTESKRRDQKTLTLCMWIYRGKTSKINQGLNKKVQVDWHSYQQDPLMHFVGFFVCGTKNRTQTSLYLIALPLYTFTYQCQKFFLCVGTVPTQLYSVLKYQYCQDMWDHMWLWGLNPVRCVKGEWLLWWSLSYPMS